MEHLRSVRASVRFGAFELDQDAGELRKQGTRMKLQEQPLQMLQVLLQRPGEIVTREELRQNVWPSDTFVDFDHGINNAIKRLREALGDTAETPHYIETLPRRGYRFLHALATTIAEASIAVLPFLSLSADPENEIFADGMSEEIIGALMQIKKLHVAARTSSFSFKGKHVDLRVIGEQLNVRTVLEGSVRKSGNRLRITAQLVNTMDGYHLWSERYDREMKDVFAIQEEIAKSIAERLQVTLDSERQPLSEQVRITWKPSSSVLRGGHYSFKEGCGSYPLSSIARKRSSWIQNTHWHGRLWRTPTTWSVSTAWLDRKLAYRRPGKQHSRPSHSIPRGQRHILPWPCHISSMIGIGRALSVNFYAPWS